LISSGRPTKPSSGIVGRADDQPGVLARQPDRLAALIVDGLHDALVDQPRKHHLDDLDGGLIGHPLAAHEIRSDAQPRQQFVDHRPTAVDDHRVDAHLSHQHHVAGETGHGLGIAHGVAAELDDHDRAGIALQIGQRLGQCAGGGDPVSGHCELLFHGRGLGAALW
jgi:hypothetical protein